MRKAKVRFQGHVFCGRERDREISLVGKGRGASLWVGPTEGNGLDYIGRVRDVYVFSGTKTLRAFANAILAATKDVAQ